MLFDNVINDDVINNLDEDTVDELLKMFEKAGY
jgi:hypothetical protein